MQKTIALFILLTLATFPATAFTEQALIPHFGQTLCYDATGTEIACAGTGQDGELQMGVHWPTPRFTNNGNGTVTDNLTGLTWLQNAKCFMEMNWYAAMAWVNALASGACGLTDGSVAGNWRMPNRNELMSLVNRQQTNQIAWLNTVGFSGVGDSGYINYWTSSARSTGILWKMNFLDGTISVYNNNTGYLRVWPVRGGQ